jgi:hypothetical protein
MTSLAGRATAVNQSRGIPHSMYKTGMKLSVHAGYSGVMLTVVDV